MAGNFYVREFTRLATDEKGHKVNAGLEPALADQVLAFSGVAASVTLDDRTRFVELHADAGCHYNLGGTATTGNMRLPADATVFKGVHRSQGRQISVVEE